MKASIYAISGLMAGALVQAAPVDNSNSNQGILDWLEEIAGGDTSTQQTAAVQQTTPTTLVTRTSAAAAAAAAPAATTTAAASAESSGSGSGFSLESLLSNQYVKSFLSYFGVDDSSSSNAATAAAPASSAPATSASPVTSSTPATTSATTNNDDFTWFTFPGGKGSTSATANNQPAATSTPTTQQNTQTSSTQESSETSSSSSGGGVTGSDKKFAQDILDAHNKYRAIHGVSALSWNEDAYQYAQNNADNYDCSGVLTHTHGQFGENLAAGFSSGSSAVAAWYDEGKTYNYQSPNSYDHFTQVVWKGSHSVGCAYKDCSAENWKLYVVCEYDPPGNVIGQRAANVLPPTS